VIQVFLTGGTGFVGRQLIGALLKRGDRCTVVSRKGTDPWKDERVRVITADPTVRGTWQQEVNKADVVVNLVGERIVEPPHRWTQAKKQAIHNSRVAATEQLVDAINAAPAPPRTLVSSSAVGYYGSQGDRKLSESAEPGSDFLAEVALDWERVAREADSISRVVCLRTGPILGLGGGLLQPLLTPFKLGLGGPWGDGKQWLPWIHLDDFVALVLFVLEREMQGALNATAPNPVTVNEFAATLGEVLRRPSRARVPEFALRLGLGEAAEVLLASQRALPTRALENGYAFRFSTLEDALRDVLC
jgi:uncharacterized protein (TIGR01777 family)